MSKNLADEILVKDQLEVYGLLKFPKDFMDIGEKTFSWVYENRPEWVKFTEEWETADGLFKAWYLYVKLRGSIQKKDNDQSADGSSDENKDRPVYTVSLDK